MKLVDGYREDGWASGLAAALAGGALVLSSGDGPPEATAGYLQTGEEREPGDELVCGPRVVEAACQRADGLLGP